MSRTCVADHAGVACRRGVSALRGLVSALLLRTAMLSIIVMTAWTMVLIGYATVLSRSTQEQ